MRQRVTLIHRYLFVKLHIMHPRRHQSSSCLLYGLNISHSENALLYPL